MRKFKSKLIAIGTALIATATIASPIIFSVSCVKNNNDNKTNDVDNNVDDNQENDTNDNTNNEENIVNNDESSDANDELNIDNSDDNSNSNLNDNDDNSNNEPSNNSNANANNNENDNSNNSNAGQSGNSSSDGTNTSTSNDLFIYDKTNRSATINASDLGLSDDIFSAYQSLFIDGINNPSILNNLTSKITSILSKYLSSSDTINFNNYKLNLSNISSNTWSIELPVTTSNNSLTSIFIDFDNLYNNVSDLLTSNNIEISSGEYFPYVNLATIKNISLENIVNMLKSPISSNVPIISNNFSFIPLDASKAITNDNVFCFDYSDTNGRSIKYLINNNGKLGLLNIKNSVTNLPKTNLITSVFGSSNNENLNTIFSQSKNFNDLNFNTITSNSNNSLILDYETVQKNTSLTSLLSNYLAFENNTLDYEAGFGLDIINYLNEYLSNLKSKWLSDDLITNENLSFYNNLKLSPTNSSSGTSNSSGSNIMIDPGMKEDSLGFDFSSFTTNIQAAATGTTVQKLNGAIGFELRNPTSEIVSLKLPINNTEFLISPSSIVSVVIEFNDSVASPCLVQDSSAINTAYLTSNFSNVKMSVSETTFTTDNLVGNVSYIDSKQQTYNFGSSPVNITPNSYALKTKVSNVSFGKTILTDIATINAAYDTYSYDLHSALRYATEKQLDDNYNEMLEAVNQFKK